MSTYTQILYHITFATKHRRPSLKQDNRTRLFKFIWGLLNKKNCHLYRINGVEDHIHIITHLHPQIALCDLVKDIKFNPQGVARRFQFYLLFTLNPFGISFIWTNDSR